MTPPEWATQWVGFAATTPSGLTDTAKTFYRQHPAPNLLFLLRSIQNHASKHYFNELLGQINPGIKRRSTKPFP